MTKRSLISRENGGWQLLVPLAQIELAVPEDLRRMIEAQLERLSTHACGAHQPFFDLVAARLSAQAPFAEVLTVVAQ